MSTERLKKTGSDRKTKMAAVRRPTPPVNSTQSSKRTRDTELPKHEDKRRRQTSDDETAQTSDDAEDYGQVSDTEVERAQGRLHEAKRYLATLTRERETSRAQKDDDDDDGEIDASVLDRELIASRLQQDTLVSRGRAFEAVAEKYRNATCVQTHGRTTDGRAAIGCVQAPGGLVYLISKGCCVYQYRVEEEGRALRKLHVLRFTNGDKGGRSARKTSDSFQCLAVSTCGTHVAAGMRSGRIVVWSVRSSARSSASTGPVSNSCYVYKQEGVFTQHRGAVLALAFRRDTATLYSASADRTVKIWSVAPGLAQVDTLFGHQDSVVALAALAQETCITAGARDRTVRLWRLVAETQLVFRPVEVAGGAQEAVSQLDEESFVSGSDQGALSLWITRRKKPLETILHAHTGNLPIGAIAALPYTDLVASGAGDGRLCLWRAAPSTMELALVREFPITGFINGLSWSDDGRVLAVAVGKEQRLGRWSVNHAAKNQLQMLTFDLDSQLAN